MARGDQHGGGYEVTKVRNLQTLLQELCANTTGDTVSVQDLLTAVGRRSHGPVLLLLGFIAISPLTIIPGANWLVALVTLIFAIQIVIGLKSPWLPKEALEFSFPRKYLVQGVDQGAKYAAMVDALVKPRLTFLTATPFLQIAALACVGAALITFPLGLVPFGPLLPGLTIVLFGLAITARDGAAMLLAGAALGGASILLSRLIPQLLS
ncbi:MAG: exopolysaccharide biosynthesis protein [Pseudomonadota bacterium]